MKKGLLTSYFDGIRDHDNGEGYGTIVRYFLPEFVTALALYSLLYLLDAWFIAHLKSTSMYATLGVTNTLLHFIVKIAEGLSVGTIVLTGIHNGAGRLEQAGRSFIDAFLGDLAQWCRDIRLVVCWGALDLLCLWGTTRYDHPWGTFFCVSVLSAFFSCLSTLLLSAFCEALKIPRRR